MPAPEAAHNATSLERVERSVEVQGINTRLFEAGPPTAPPLLYLHGTFLGNLWLDFHKALAQHFHVYAPDIPGFGLTTRPDWMRDMSDYTLYLRDLMNALGLQKPFIVAHSLGGWMALEIAVWFPERVNKLVLSNSAGIRVKGHPIAHLLAMHPEEILATCFDNLAAAAPLIPPALNEEYLLDQYRQRTTLAALAWNPDYDPKLERRLASLSCPTLIIWGEHDRLIPPIYGDTLHQLIAGSRLVKIPGTAHMPMFEKPEEWSAPIIAFLKEDSANTAQSATSQETANA